MKGLHSKQADGGAPMSPACCAQQLILEAGICSHLVEQASDAGSAVPQQSLKGLLACELAVALDPSVWYQVRPCNHLSLLSMPPCGPIICMGVLRWLAVLV